MARIPLFDSIMTPMPVYPGTASTLIAPADPKRLVLCIGKMDVAIIGVGTDSDLLNTSFVFLPNDSWFEIEYNKHGPIVQYAWFAFTPKGAGATVAVVQTRRVG